MTSGLIKDSVASVLCAWMCEVGKAKSLKKILTSFIDESWQQYSSSIIVYQVFLNLKYFCIFTLGIAPRKSLYGQGRHREDRKGI